MTSTHPANGAETPTRHHNASSHGVESEKQKVKRVICNENYLKAVKMTISGRRRIFSDIFTAFQSIVSTRLDINNLEGKMQRLRSGLRILGLKMMKAAD